MFTLMKLDKGWQFVLCSDCGKRIAPKIAHRPFADTLLCDDCLDDLFLTSTPVHQQPCP